MAASRSSTRAKSSTSSVADSSRALAERASEFASHAHQSTRDAALKLQASAKAHPVAATVGLAALVGAVVGIVLYRRKH